jgi:hypothetical protein
MRGDARGYVADSGTSGEECLKDRLPVREAEEWALAVPKIGLTKNLSGAVTAVWRWVVRLGAEELNRVPLGIEAVDQLAGLDPETLGEAQDRRQARLATATLEATDAGRVDAGGVGEDVLGDPFPCPQRTHPLSEGSAGDIGVFVDLAGHLWERGGSLPNGPERSGRERIGLERVGRVR